MLKRYVMLAGLLAVVALLAIAFAARAQEVQLGPTTQRVLARGELICGVHGALAGFGIVDAQGEYSGFDVDICRAFAAAIFGDATKISFRNVVAADRQAVIQGGEVDVMSRNTTWTFSRDTLWGVDFGPTTFYDGQGIAATVASGATTMEDLDGGTICVQSGTTTELNLTDAITKRGLSIELKVFPDADTTWQAFVEGACDSFTTDKSGIVAYVASAADPSLYYIMEETLSKEPLGPLWSQSDPQFGDIITWTVYGLIQAEEWGITSQNIDEFVASDDPGVQRLLGQADNAAGSLLGIPNDFMVNVIRQVGNYGEIYARNLGVAPFNMARGLNALWTDGGLQYAPPFR